MTRAQIRAALQRRLPRTELTTADYDRWIDNGLLDLCTRRVHIHALERVGTTILSVANQPDYARPLGSFSILYLEDTTNQRVLTRFPGGFEEYLRAKQNAPTAQANDVPSHFAEWGESFYVFKLPPVSNINWVPYVYVRPTLAATDGASPDIPDEWHYAIELIAAEHGFRDLGDEERADKVAEEFARWLGMRDTTRRQTARFNVPRAGGVRPHPDYTRARFWRP